MLRNMSGRGEDMKKTTKKILLVTVLALLPVLSSCKQNNTITNGRFEETKHISVYVPNTSDDADNNEYTRYIHDGMLKDHNVEVHFVKNNGEASLRRATAADISYEMYTQGNIASYSSQNDLVELSALLETERDELPNLFALLGDKNIYFNGDNATGKLYSIHTTDKTRVNSLVFIRKDWLDRLGLPVPKTRAEFHNCLCAFRDNADMLLDGNGDELIPFALNSDVLCGIAPLVSSCMDSKMSDKDGYINGFYKDGFMQDGCEEALKTLNSWYSEGLVQRDFADYRSDDINNINKMKQGCVGAFCAQWDMPYKGGEDSIEAVLERNIEGAGYIAADTFEDGEGGYTKWIQPEVSRNLFLPATNGEPEASLLYLDWISEPEHIKYLQFGKEGTDCKTKKDGSVSVIKKDTSRFSPLNVDYTLTCSGVCLGSDKAERDTIAGMYEGVDSSLVAAAYDIAGRDNRQLYDIGSSTQLSDEEAANLQTVKDRLIIEAVKAAPDDFDAVWKKGFADFMSAGGERLINERIAKWRTRYQDAENIGEDLDK